MSRASINTQYKWIFVVALVCGFAISGYYLIGNFLKTPTVPIIDLSHPKFQEGVHYQKLSTKITEDPIVKAFLAENSGKIQVMEFFNYNCFWCQRLHPLLTEWAKKKPNNVVFSRLPIIFHPTWEPAAKVYLIVSVLGKTDALDMAFFKAAHETHLDLSKESILKQFALQQGIPEKTFDELYHSFSIGCLQLRANELSNALQITRSPAVVVSTPNGLYISTPPMAGSEAALIAVVDHLISLGSGKEGGS